MANKPKAKAKPHNPPAPRKGERPAPSGPAAPAAGEAGTIALDVLAKLLMLTPQRVNQLNREGWIPKAGPGRYRIAEAVQGYIRFLKDEQRRASKSASASRVQDARARQIELNTARDEHRLIETEEAIGFVDEALGRLKAGMSGIPARVSRDIEFRRKIETEIDDEFRRAADHFQQASSALRSGGTIAAPVAEDDAG